MTATSTSSQGTFVTVPGDRHSEVARTLTEPVPQALTSLARQRGARTAKQHVTAA